MKSMIAVVGIVALTLIVGCSTKPPRDIDTSVRQRLTRYSEAWKQGDAAGVRESFAPRDNDEVAMLDALAELAPAQAKLRSAYHDALGPTGRIIFGDGDFTKLVPGTATWISYAQSAADPYDLVYKKPVVLVQLEEKDRNLIVPARRIDGGWKLELGGFLDAHDVQDAAEMSQRLHLLVRQTDDMTVAVRTGDPKEIQREMLRQITEMRGLSHSQLRMILGQESTTTTSTTQPTTAPRTGARENPP